MDAVPGSGEDNLDPLALSTEDPIALFVSTVKESWNIQLAEDTYINRYYSCCIRNMVREHMSSFKEATSTMEFYEKILNYQTIKASKAYTQLMAYNDNEFSELMTQLPSVEYVDTIGKYIAFLVMCIICTAKERFVIEKNNAAKVYETVRTLTHKFLNRASTIHSKFKCKNMFIGLPCYMFPSQNAGNEIIEWGRDLLNNQYMSRYKDYIEYLNENPRDPNERIVSIYFMRDTWYFQNSVPEYVLKGLCFRHDDPISLEKDTGVRFFLKFLPHENSYVYYDVQTKTNRVEFPKKVTTRNDCFAISVNDNNIKNLSYFVTTYSHQFYMDQLFQVDKLTNLTDVTEDLESELPPLNDFPSDESPVINGLPDDDNQNGRRGDQEVLRQKAWNKIEERLERVEKDHIEIAKSCHVVAETLDRLERHADSLRHAMVNLAKKIDYQTGYSPMMFE
ncbi:ORF-125 [Teiidae poxvirus 1]|nr:ORF-125 [Teiidae poxvirus 1]